jgi:hypothetical protein
VSKIVQAVNAMISNQDKISSAMQSGSEVFFLYKDKYKWSILRTNEGEHSLFFYPGVESLADLVGYDDFEMNHVSMLRYSDREIGTKEAKASFAELLIVVKEHVYGVNQVLDDIIDDSDIAF